MSTAPDEQPVEQQDQEEAREEMRAFEERDELPSDPADWPDGKAKFLTYAHDSDEAYGEGLTAKLGPASLERGSDGSVTVDGEPVDNPDDYKGEPIPGGPTDPNAERTTAERNRLEEQD